MDTLGAKIRRLREGRGMTQLQLAGDDFTRGYISQVESGTTIPSPPALGILAARLERPISYFTHEPSRRDEKVIRLLLRYAEHACKRGKLDRALERLTEARELAAEWALERLEYEARYRSARVLLQQGKPTEAADTLRTLFQSGLALPLEDRVRCELNLGYILNHLEQYERARQWLLTGLEHLEKVDPAEVRLRLPGACAALGHACMRLELWDEAMSAYQRLHKAGLAENQPERTGQGLVGIGTIHAYRKQWAEAEACFFGAAQALARIPAEAFNHLVAVFNLGQVRRQRGDAGYTLVACRRYRAYCHEVGRTVEVARGWKEEGFAHLDQGNLDGAKQCMAEGYAELEKADDTLVRAELTFLDAQLAIHDGRSAQARQLLYMALALSKNFGWHSLRREVESGLSNMQHMAPSTILT